MSCHQQKQVEFGDGRVVMNGAGVGHAAMPLALEADGDFEPQTRDRCNTWPLQKSAGELGHTSPLIHEEIPEEEGEDSLSGSNDNFDQLPPSQHLPPPPHHVSPNQQHSSPSSLSPNSNGTLAVSSANPNNACGPKKNSARRNAWGNLSYADLITQAIMSSPEKRLTLSQIYDWMVQNVPYFRDKGDSNSSAGWKNSIRHNLSLHSRFVRIQNEGAGKSSWWVINPDAKPGKSSRRRTSTMPSGQDAVKASLEKKRRGVKKKIEQQRAALAAALGQAAGSNQGDGAENGLGDMGDVEFATAAPYPNHSPVEFRHRSDSNLSNYSSVGSRLSPAYEDLELFDWEAMTSGGLTGTNTGSQRDLFNQATGDSGNELATSMNLSMNLASEAPPPYAIPSATPVNASNGAWRKPQQPRSGVSVSSSPLVHHQASPVKASPSSSRANGGYSPVGGVAVKSEPPNYQELYTAPAAGPSSVTAAPSNCNGRSNGNSNHVQLHLRNTLLIKKEAAAAMAHPCSGSATVPNATASTYGAIAGAEGEYSYYAPRLHQPQLQHHQQYQPSFLHGVNPMGPGTAYSATPQQILPTELSDIQYDNMFKSDIQCDIDQVIRHELNIAGKIDFSIGDHFTNI